MSIFKFWKRDTTLSQETNPNSAHIFEPYTDEKLQNGYYSNQAIPHETISRPSRPASLAQAVRHLGTVFLVLTVAGLAAYHVVGIKPCKSSASAATTAPLPLTVESAALELPQFGLRPNSWFIITFNDTNCEAANKTDILTGTGPSKCILLGDGEDTQSIHWAPDPKEDLKACIYKDDRCKGANTTVNRGGCASPGYVGYAVKVIGFFENC